MTHLNKDQKRRELIKLLQQKAYRKGDFTLSSGRKSEHYVNCKPVTLNGWGLKLASSLMLDLIDEDAVAVGGLTLGADPLVSAVAMMSYQTWRPLDALIIRKTPKGHGTQSQVEGPLPPKGAKIAVLEDVTTTGASALLAVDVCRELGYNVERVVTIVDRKNYEPFLWHDHDLELKSLFTLDDIKSRNQAHVRT